MGADDLADDLDYLLYLAFDGKVVVLSFVPELCCQLLEQINYFDDTRSLLEHWIVQLRH